MCTFARTLAKLAVIERGGHEVRLAGTQLHTRCCAGADHQLSVRHTRIPVVPKKWRLRTRRRELSRVLAIITVVLPQLSIVGSHGDIIGKKASLPERIVY